MEINSSESKRHYKDSMAMLNPSKEITVKQTKK
jgi:hypothetical protein